MGEMHEKITARKLCEMTATDADTMRMRFAKLRKAKPEVFPGAWRIDGELSKEQITALVAAGERRGGVSKESELSVFDLKSKVGEPNRGPSNEAAPETVTTESRPRKWPLWVAFVITAGASIPNMAEVTMSMKSGQIMGYSLTAAFTVVPFLLIMARVRGLFGWMVVVGVMGYTGFCNTAAIFGGLTALDSGYILKPTVFLEAVTNLLNTDYLNTARALSALMALLIGSIEFVAFKNLSK
jgi:hypothetical protein